MILYPSVPLSPYISHYLTAKLDVDDTTYLPATSSPNLVIFIQGGVSISHQNLPGVRASSAYIEGPCLAPRSSRSEAYTEVVSIHF